jgi:hypothetical protein
MLRAHKFKSMLSTIRYGLLAVLCFVTTLAHGLTARVSDTFPLTDTIYGPAAGSGKLRSDGRQPFLFWLDEDHDRVSVTRIDGGERVAKLVFPFAVYAMTRSTRSGPARTFWSSRRIRATTSSASSSTPPERRWASRFDSRKTASGRAWRSTAGTCC